MLAPMANLPTSVIRDLHRRTKRHIVGHVAVNSSRQTVPSPIESDPALNNLRAIDRACRLTMTEQLRRQSFPLNLIPHTPLHDDQEALP